MPAYYNEIDPFAVAWLRGLMKAGQIPDGVIDTRSLLAVEPADLAGFTQCHFFAGIGGWALALRLAGWPDARPVWTGSCPCQPFSVAGAGAGPTDPRHLWPTWFRLIAQCRPRTVFGEQVASLDGRYWLDFVLPDLESLDYAVAPFDLPAAGVGAPHKRQRFYVVADADGGHPGDREQQCGGEHRLRADRRRAAGPTGEPERPGRLADDDQGRRAELPTTRLYGGWAPAGGGTSDPGDPDGQQRHDPDRCRPADRLVDAERPRLEGLRGDGDDRDQPGWLDPHAARPVTAAGGAGFWDALEWLPCSDGKARPVEPGTFPLAHGIPARVGRLRGYGNAIVPQVAAALVRAYLDYTSEGVTV